MVIMTVSKTTDVEDEGGDHDNGDGGDDDQWSQSPPCQCGGRGTSARGAGRHLASSHSPGFVIRSYRYELSFPHLVVPEIHLADDLLLSRGARLRQSPLHTEESSQLPR